MSNKDYLKKVVGECAKEWGPPIPTEFIESLFYYKDYRVQPKIGKAFDYLPVDELLVMYDDFMQMKRDFEFYKFNVDRKPKLENALKLLDFLERSKKAGIISIEIKR
jgi:hypothetical protein